MTDVPSLDVLRKALSLVFPVEGGIVVGAGSGLGLEDFSAAPSLLAIDARPECIDALQRRFSDWAGLTAVQAVIACKSGEAVFHFANNPAESALISPAGLQPIWRNLSERSVENLETLALTDLLDRIKLASDFRYNWLLVDCLPATSILEGAVQLLECVDVLELRCVCDDVILAAHDASLSSAVRLLEAHGFRLLVQYEETHPLLCKAIFCRDAKKLADELTARVEMLTQAKSAAEMLAAEYAQSLEARDKGTAINVGSDVEEASHNEAEQLLQRCLNAEDIHAATDQILDDPLIQPGVQCLFLLKFAQTFAAKKDHLTATHYLRQGRYCFDDASAATQGEFLNLLVRIGRADTAADIIMNRALRALPAVPLDPRTAQAVAQSYESIRTLQEKKSEHGHDLLLDWLAHNLSKLQTTASKRVVIEIGTTREDVPGQGSTAKIANFCLKHGLDFITVDMDPHNSHMAEVFFARNDMPFAAITEKGEEYLRQYKGRMDFVFLDAYDFDHGKHSELRQSRYERFLGNRIDERACHQMHLDCAESVLQKLAPDGVVCIDDTWLDEGERWTAKGTLAMPYLLEKGYILLEARNRAALLKPPAATA